MAWSRRRGLYWAGIGVALVAVVAGTVVAVRGNLATSGPDDAVSGYFAALERGDAPAALGFGALPSGPRRLLTSPVLREQQRLAPIGDMHVSGAARHGDTATVSVRYSLGYPSGRRQVSDQVEVIRRDGSWRLTRVAVRVRMQLSQARAVATIAGTAVPDGDVLMFPGVVPISFDGGYLQLAPAGSSVPLSGGGDLRPTVAVSASGHRAVLDAVQAALTSCLSGAASADSRCPLPSDRYVPGGIRGTVTRSAVARLSLTVSDDPAGVIDVPAGRVRVTGRYAVLDFDNQAVTRTGSFILPISATVLAHPPPAVEWTGAR